MWGRLTCGVVLLTASHIVHGASPLNIEELTPGLGSAPAPPPVEEVEREQGQASLRARQKTPAVSRRQWITPSSLSSAAAEEVDSDTELPSSGKFLIHNGVTATFSSPGYPDDYPPSIWTSWIFDAKDRDAKLHVSCPDLALGRQARLTLRTEAVRQVFHHNSPSPPALTSGGRVTASLRAGGGDHGRLHCTVRAELIPQLSLDDLSAVQVNDPLCGKTMQTTRIVGGVVAPKGANPWLVGVTTRSREDMFCGGSIINERYVLTAAHCVKGRKVWAVNVQVRKYKRKKDEDELRFKVKRIILHPGYSRATLQNDIALLELEEPLRLLIHREDARVRPVCLPTASCRGGSGPACYDGRTASVAGWGVLQERTKNYPTTLRTVELPVLTTPACRDSQPEVITDQMLCTSYENGGRDACQGDSGGPLTVGSEDGVASQIGIVSFGKGCGHQEYPAVYVRVSEYFDWIVENAKL